ncbi:hypothetical protein HDU99_004306, partial [Rhizoclosmatium hyalinum]
MKLALLILTAIASFVHAASGAASKFQTFYSALPACPKKCLSSQFLMTQGTFDLIAGLVTSDDVIYFAREPNSVKTFLDCAIASCKADGQALENWNASLISITTGAIAEDKVDLAVAKPDNASTVAWSPYYTSGMTNYDWINLREGVKTIIQVRQFGPVFLRLAWHDASTGNVVDGTGGPHATMNLQDPEDPENKGLQRAIDALEPLYEVYQKKISRADLWSFAGAVAVRVMGGPVIPWRPGRNDITDIKQARLGPGNRIPGATDSWETQVAKFKKLGLNSTDLGALIYGGHGVGRCHRQYSGYHGPWTGQENTFSNFHGTLLRRGTSKNVSLPEINSWQLNDTNPVNGGLVMLLPSDLAMARGITDFEFYKTGRPGPAADKIAL